MRNYTGDIASLTRGDSSVNGNPAWIVKMADGSEFRTSSDAGISYAIGNHYVGQKVTLSLTRAGRITNIHIWAK